MEPEEKSPPHPPLVSSGDQNETPPISSPSTFSVPLSVASPIPEPPSLSPFLGFEPFESRSESNLEPAAGEILSGVPRPLEALYETPVPPFLSKTFDLVENPSLDAIISWGATGESFVVWDPAEFARTVLPRNFKHCNFSSFVRQLNTYGFRKVDTDKWEFANEGFKKGQRRMLKNIQRRKSHQPTGGSSSGSSHDPNQATMELEIEHLRKEKSLMMREVVELQLQQRDTVQHMDIVNEKLQSAERRQKQMVSFLGKIFQNTSFLARLRQTKEQKSIASPRTTRKFLKHQPHETGSSGPSPKGRVFKYPLLEMRKSSVLGTDSTQYVPFQAEDVLADELAMMRESPGAPDKYVADLARETLDHGFKGKGVTGQQAQQGPDYLVSFPDSLGKEEAFSELGVSVGESMATEEEGIWGMGFEAGVDKSCLGNELWGYDSCDYNMQQLDGFSDIWGIGPMPLAGSLSVERWPEEEYSPFDDLANKENRDKE